MKVVIWATTVSKNVHGHYPQYHGPFMTVANAEHFCINIASETSKANVVIEELKKLEERVGKNYSMGNSEKESILKTAKLMAVEHTAVKREVAQTSGQKAA